MWASKQQLSRRECLDRAHKARSQGKISKAIQLYEQVLARTPGDYEVHARIAPLLVKARRNTDASSNFARAIEGYEEAGFRTKAISVAVLSAEQLPKRLECWMRAAELYREDGRIEDAVDVLVQARLQFAGRRHARSALVVLEELFSIEPSFPVRFDRARTRALLGERREA
ncbi:MAG: tetratricopeptide repeat protein, partial [Myxococcota bacterium]